MSDAPIIRYYEGSDEAFEEIHAEWWPRLVHFLAKLGAPWQVAEDLAQDALYHVARTRWGNGRYDPSKTFDGWILKIARNLWLDYLRKRIRRPEESLSHSEGVDGVFLDASQLARQESNILARQLHEMLERLPAEQREAVILHDFEGLTFREAGDVLEVPERTVFSRRGLALNKLRLLFGGSAISKSGAASKGAVL